MVSEILRDLGKYGWAVVSNGFGIAVLFLGVGEIVAFFSGKRIPAVSAGWRLTIAISLLVGAQFVAWHELDREFRANASLRLTFYEIEEADNQNVAIVISSYLGAMMPVHLILIYHHT